MSKKEVNRVKEVHKTNCFGFCEIIAYENCEKVTVRFVDTGYEAVVTYSNLTKGKVQDPLFKSVKGVGYVGIGEYSKGSHPELYNVWYSMIERCYYQDYTSKYQSYINCYVDVKWHNFQSFANWAESRMQLGLDLDKDLLGDGLMYSEDSCCFLPSRINRMLIEKDCITGHRTKSGSYHFRVRDANSKIIGKCFKIQSEGVKWYWTEKSRIIRDLAEIYRKRITEEVYQALISYSIKINT